MSLFEIPESESWQESDSEDASPLEVISKVNGKEAADKKKVTLRSLCLTGFRYAIYGFFFLRVSHRQVKNSMRLFEAFKNASMANNPFVFILYLVFYIATIKLVNVRTRPTRFS